MAAPVGDAVSRRARQSPWPTVAVEVARQIGTRNATPPACRLPLAACRLPTPVRATLTRNARSGMRCAQHTVGDATPRNEACSCPATADGVLGSCIAADVLATEAVPAFPAATMDGYAVVGAPSCEGRGGVFAAADHAAGCACLHATHARPAPPPCYSPWPVEPVRLAAMQLRTAPAPTPSSRR